MLLRVICVISQLNQETCLLSRNAEEMYEGIEIVATPSTKKKQAHLYLSYGLQKIRLTLWILLT